MLQNRWLYESNLEAQLARWKADLAILKAKLRPAEIDAASQHDESIEALQHKHDMTSYHLSSLRGASDDAWQSVKASTETSWMDFTAIVQDPSLHY
ncbi:hypothetical protein [Geothrix edaphica]|uniref:Uncharacterized protein n=1 Tax=Geothrix edaphica TaxID=2927976 RepID=A0ABQ5PY70_9BACT|nr:hypothetical protein [Geothrix edaphica]GLH67001.1 hypothetical protein GETHED_13650 [Geothrix edaphica]